jgi:hypothetical protein
MDLGPLIKEVEQNQDAIIFLDPNDSADEAVKGATFDSNVTSNLKP